VEARGKATRLQHLVPIPRGDSFDAVNAGLLAMVDARLTRPREPASDTIGVRFDQAQRVLRAAPKP
jgi:hypothetical protein